MGKREKREGRRRAGLCARVVKNQRESMKKPKRRAEEKTKRKEQEASKEGLGFC